MHVQASVTGTLGVALGVIGICLISSITNYGYGADLSFVSEYRKHTVLQEE